MRISPAVLDGRSRRAPAPSFPAPSEARAAFKESASVGPGFVPLGLAFGSLVTQSGLDRWWAGLSAALIHGGSFEFLLIGMVTAAAPLAAIAVTAFMVRRASVRPTGVA